MFRVFLKPGVTSVGGPIAHLGYFRGELIVRRKWIDEPGHGDLVALCQFLPGPASSQGDFRSACCAQHGLKLVAVAVVAQAIWGMTRTLTPDRARAGIALAAVALIVISGGSLGQIAAIALGAFAGLRLCRGEGAPVSGHLSFPVSRRNSAAALILFAALAS